MNLELLLSNFWAWAAQVFMLCGLGVFLPLLFRLRHPQSQLFYYYGLLITCLVLPAVQPWNYPEAPADARLHMEFVDFSFIADSAAISRPTSVAQIILSIVALGFVLRIAWLGVGLWRLRKYRREATLLATKPDAFVRAEHLTGVSAEVRISATAVGPVTFGFRRPVVLIPQSVLEMNTDKQCGIVVHELLHVRRRDWLFTLLEEFYGRCSGFIPSSGGFSREPGWQGRKSLTER